MANNPTVGVFIPGFLNTCNSPSQFGQQDAYGTQYPSGTTAGKAIAMGPQEAQNLAAPGTQLFDGFYQWVQVDSGATAANVAAGLAAFIKLDSGPTQGAIPETSYEVPQVTSEDQVVIGGGSTNLFAGVFLNSITPGNWGFIFNGGGRATVALSGTISAAIGSIVNVGTGTNAGKFNTVASPTTTSVSVGLTAQTSVANSNCVCYFPDIFYRFPN
ncbi:MAG TPA: hypothetical protein VGK96_28450 [Candidatus Sulfotelmatobacter sp.]|jgi:hypothetical protein